jgi:hypothetical protein
MFDIGYGACLPVAAEQFHLAAAVLAAKLCVAVGKRDGNGLYLPERLVASALFYAATLHFAFIDLLAFDCH